MATPFGRVILREDETPSDTLAYPTKEASPEIRRGFCVELLADGEDCAANAKDAKTRGRPPRCEGRPQGTDTGTRINSRPDQASSGRQSRPARNRGRSEDHWCRHWAPPTACWAPRTPERS